ncbi:MAG: glycerate kinase [Desulfonauticus sp.]|nr:glycerate kinase [Desulfonauticus sp.]
MPNKKLSHHIQDIFTQAIASALPTTIISHNLTLDNTSILLAGQKIYNLNQFQHIVVLGAGKASALMAKNLENILQTYLTEGIIITKYNHTCNLKKTTLIEAGHPIPDHNSLEGGKLIVETIQRYKNTNTLFIFLLSGGASSLMVLPEPPLTLEDKQLINSLLLSSGANIYEINTIRKHLSQLKGGKLAKLAHPNPILTLVISDVIGDDLSVIGSGPTYPDSSTWQDCLTILQKYKLWERLPNHLQNFFSQGIKGQIADTPKKNDSYFNSVKNIILASNRQVLRAAATRAQQLGYTPLILTSSLQGEAKEAAKFLASIAREITTSGHPLKPPCCIISGGETTVNMGDSQGKGGRNQELALAFALELDPGPNVCFLSAGTDGTDGPTDAAGAIITSETLKLAKAKGLNPEIFLLNHDSYNFFKPIGGLFITGPTFTNVMDVQIILCS